MTESSRLEKLETRIAYQDEAIEDLNKAVTAQWKEIDRLTRELAVLAERVAQAGQGAAPDPSEEPLPPHY